jgi:trehalose-6-phosphatase
MSQSVGNELVELQPIAYFKWKGKTFNQITSALKQNTFTLNEGDNRNIFRPPPVKLYRKEIASP